MQWNHAPDGAKEFCGGWFSAAPAGAWMVLLTLTHGFTAGYYLSRLRRWNSAIRNRQPEIEMA
jgi:hypothetical protein